MTTRIDTRLKALRTEGRPGLVTFVTAGDPDYATSLAVLKSLPAGYRQTLLMLESATRDLQDFYAHQAMPYILGYSSLAATAGAFPVPWLDLLVLPGIQTRMIDQLAEKYAAPRADIATDVIAMLQDLADKGFLTQAREKAS